MAAALFAQPRAINLETVEPEAVQRQRCPIRLELRTGPVPHGAPLACMRVLAIAHTAEIVVFNRRPIAEFADMNELLLDVPERSAVAGRIEECFLQPSDCPVDGALTPAQHPGKGILGSGAKSGARRR